MGLTTYLLRYALRDMVARKTRTTLTLLGITIGVAFMIMLSSLTASMKERVKMDVESLLGSAIIVSDKDVEPIPIYIGGEISKIPGVKSVVPVILGGCMVKGEGALLLGVPVSEIPSFVPMPTGRLPTSDSSYEFLTTDISAQQMHVKINGTIKIFTQTERSGVNLKLVGTTEIGGFFQGLAAGKGAVIVVGLEMAQKLLSLNGYVTYFVIRLNDTTFADSVIVAIKSINPRVKVLTEWDLLKGLTNILDTIDALMIAISGVSLTVAGLSTMNAITMSVTEKRREIGVLKSIGAERWHVLFIFSSQGIILGIFGGLLGGILGYVGAYYLVSYILPNYIIKSLTFPFVFDVQSYAKGFVVSILVSFISSLVPSYEASKVRPIEALRYE
ncbi:MAG: ABC transporter permease [Thermoproteota archaeon]